MIIFLTYSLLFIILYFAFILAHEPIASEHSLACSSTAGVLTPQSPEVPHFGDLIMMSVRKRFLITPPGTNFQPLKQRIKYVPEDLEPFPGSTVEWEKQDMGKHALYDAICKGNTDVPHVCGSMCVRARLGKTEGNLARYIHNCYMSYLRWRQDAGGERRGKGRQSQA